MKYSLQEQFQESNRKQYAIPAFNFSDFWELQGILEAAREMEAPVIVSTNMQIAKVHGVALLAAFSKLYTENSRTPLFFHLDHSNDPDLCKQFIDAGFASVMYDGSSLALEDNIQRTTSVVKHASARGTCVEAEIGRILGSNEESDFSGDDFLTKPEDAVVFAERTGCDSLAVGIGNAHGFYQSEPHLNFDRLAAIHSVVDIPLVLHGGSGIDGEAIKKTIQHGIRKVNVGTELHHAYLRALQQQSTYQITKPNIPNFMENPVKAVREIAKKWIRVCRNEKE